ncbi:hypothetical protein JCM5296_003807 [Sporobolomyces johnsonii]
MSRSTDLLTFTTPTGRTTALPPSFALVVTDTLESPAAFLLAHLIARALRPPPAEGRKARRVVLVGVRDREEHWASSLKKQGVQLATERAAGRFRFVDASSGALEDACVGVAEALGGGGAGDDAVVLVDDLSALMWLGNDVRSVVRFFARLRALVSATASSLVVLLHADDVAPTPSIESEEDQYLFRKVLQGCDLWLEARSLGGETRGELAIHRAPALDPSHDYGVETRSGARALQYKVEESGAVFEAKGLGRFF